MRKREIAESLVAVYTHTHTTLLNEKINKLYIKEAHKLSILC